MPLNGSMIQVKSGNTFLVDCYHAPPTGKVKGGLVVIMEIFGLTNHIKEVCDDYAKQGYDVVSPALFDRIERNFVAGHATGEALSDIMEMAQRAGTDNAMLDVQACINFLKEEGAGDVCIVGYCYGGAITWFAASRCEGLSAASAYYGTRIMSLADEEPKCPVILHFGKEDLGTPESKVEKVSAAHPEVPIYWYEAGHAFNNSDRADAYDTKSAKLARKRTLDFFAEHLN